MVLNPTREVVKKLPPLAYWAIGALLFMVMELGNSASLQFASLAGLFVLLVGVAVQSVGGIKNLLGLCILFFAIENVLLSQVVKFLLRQPPEARLEVPLTTMEVYCVGVASMAVGGFLSRYLRLFGGRTIFPTLTDPQFLRRFAIAATTFAAFRSGIVSFYNFDQTFSGLTTGGFVGPLRQLAGLDSLAVASGTAAIITSSQGRRSVGTLNIIPILIPTIAGFLGTYRAGITGAVLGYAIACWAYGFRFKVQHYVGMAAFIYVLTFIITPYSLAARKVAKTSDFFKNVQKSWDVLQDVIASPGKYSEEDTNNLARVPEEMRRARYYPFESNILERFAMIRNADAIISATVYRGTMGWRTITPGFEMLPPSFLYEDKPTLGTANLLAHRSKGLVNKDDMVTQITIGSFADSFSSFYWVGAMIIPGLILMLYRLIYGVILKLDLTHNVFAIALVPTFSVAFSEGTIQVHIVYLFQTSIITTIGFAIPYLVTRLLDATHLSRRRRRAIAAAQSAPS